jgi:hypothetical protein
MASASAAARERILNGILKTLPLILDLKMFERILAEARRKSERQAKESEQ